MALLNPVYGLIVPFLCVFTIPLAIFAGITTTIAFSVLMIRVTVVYLDIAIAYIPQYMMGRSITRSLPSSQYATTTTTPTHGRISPLSPISPKSATGSLKSLNNPETHRSPSPPMAVAGPAVSAPMSDNGWRSPSAYRSRTNLTLVGYGFASGYGLSGRRSRRSSQVSMASVGTVTPMHEGEVGALLHTVPSGSGLCPSVGMDRDFEGVGGWRIDDRDDCDWTNINSRLELPGDRNFVRHHQRPPSSSGPVTPGADAGFLMMKGSRKDALPAEDRDVPGGDRPHGKASMSPNSSRVRIATQGGIQVQIPAALTSLDHEGSYFPLMSAASPKTMRKSVA